jgi:hypothetical protein
MDAIIIIIGLFENVFIDLWVFACWVCGRDAAIIIINIRALFFFVLFTSLFSNDAVYINNVIIPDENVMIRINDTQLLADALYIGIVDIIDITKIVIAREIGLIVFVLIYNAIIVIATIFSSSFDLQDQCFV